MKIKIHSTNFSNGCIFENFSNFRTFTFKLSFTKQATIVINNEPINIIKAPFFIALIVLVFSSCTTSRRNSSLSFKGGLSQNKSVIVPSNFAEEKMSSDEISLGESNRLLPEKKVAIILKKNTYLAKILNPNKPLSKEPTPKKKEVNPNKFSKKKIPVTEFFFMHKFKGDEQVIMKKFFGNIAGRAWIRMIAYLGIPILFFLYFASVSFSAVTAGTVAVITLMGFLTSIFGIISIAILIPVMLLCLYFGLRAAYWFKEYLKISTMKPFEKEELGNSILLWGGGYLILDILLYLGMIFTPFGGILSAFVGVLDFLFPLMLYSGLGYLMYKNTTKK